MKNYLISVDLEGIHGIVGEPYKGLGGALEDYKLATENAVKEINVACKALFEEGADAVYVWDNHGGGSNLDFSKIDSRAIKLEPSKKPTERLDFLKGIDVCGNIFLGYHAREGTLGGVLAHTYSSVAIQYYKFNGKSLGEYEMDSVFAAQYGVPPIFAASDDICVQQMKEFTPDLTTAVTKVALGRNAAEFIDEEKVLREIYGGVKKAVNSSAELPEFSFPCRLEVRYTRMEDAEVYYKRNRDEYGLNVEYVDNDCHVLSCEINNPFEMKLFL